VNVDRVLCEWLATRRCQPVPVSVAYGAHGLAPGEDPREALAAADRAMYRQKRACAGGPARDPQALVRR
jgi:hypothetical protein